MLNITRHYTDPTASPEFATACSAVAWSHFPSADVVSARTVANGTGVLIVGSYAPRNAGDPTAVRILELPVHQVMAEAVQMGAVR